MENTSQPMDVNVVDLGDDISSVSLAPGIGDSETVGEVLSCLRFSLANADSESGAYEKKQRARQTSKVWNDFESVVVRGIIKSQCTWCKRLVSVTK
jgi:hypothetical protein